MTQGVSTIWEATISANDIIIQSIGLINSIALCFLGFANLKWVRIISIFTYVLTIAQSVFLSQPALVAMNLVNLAYCVATLFEGRYPFIATTRYRVASVAIALAAACSVQYIIMGQSFLSPATFAILGGLTGLIMAISHNFWALKAFTVLNVAAWVTYCLMVGAYTNLIGNAFILGGVAFTVWVHLKKQKGTPISDDTHTDTSDA